MIGHEFDATTGEELLHIVRALGQHRYVDGRLHLVHAFAVAAVAEASSDSDPDLAEAVAWARGVLADPNVDAGSKDERLYRRSSDAELVAVLRAFWTAGPRRERACAHLLERLGALGIDGATAASTPFDEAREEDMFPVLVDAGWELLPLSRLEPERHRGAMDAFGDALAFEVARFEEESAIPRVAALHELPAMGCAELVHLFDDAGRLRAPFVLWASGHEAYVDYLLRGVKRAVANRMAKADGS